MDMEEENCSKKHKIGNDEPQIEMKPSTGNSEKPLMKPTNSEEPQMQPTNSEEPQKKTSFSNSEKPQLEPSNSEEQRTKLGGKSYCVQYENNNSKRWDGKRVLIDGQWLHSVCDMSEIHCGDKIKLPWTAKKGKVQYWNAVVVDNTAMESTPESTKGAKTLKNSKSTSKVNRIGKVRVAITSCCKIYSTYRCTCMYLIVLWLLLAVQSYRKG